MERYRLFSQHYSIANKQLLASLSVFMNAIGHRLKFIHQHINLSTYDYRRTNRMHQAMAT